MIRVTELDKIITDGLNNGLKKGGSWGKTEWDALKRAAWRQVYSLMQVRQPGENLLSDQELSLGLCGSREGVGERGQCYLWLIHTDVWQKPNSNIVKQLSSN